jgi:P-type E1-E2 ATPase
MTIFTTLKSTGLENFYDIMQSENRNAIQAQFSNQYDYLCDADFLADFAQNSEGTKFHFYIDGIECLACSFVMQNINKVSKKIKATNFSVDKNILELTFIEKEGLKEIANFISALGYKIIPLKNLEQAENQLNSEKIAQLKRIGLTGAILMNMMIYSVSIYAGADGWFKQFFGHVQALLYLPIFLYSATPFYKGLYTQLKNRTFTIDLPLNVSILFGSIISYYNYFQGSEIYYFDSLTMFIFLILSTRFFLYYLYRREVSQNLFDGVYTSQQVKLLQNNNILPKHILRIRHDDIIQIATNEIIPLDGELISENAYINESLLTGESAPVSKTKGDQVLSGSQNLSGDLFLKVLSTAKENSFHHYLTALRFDMGSIQRYSKIGNKYSIILTSIVVALAVGLFIYSPTQESLNKILALLIVCCPCALGIGIPLASILKIKSLAKRGIMIRKNQILEVFNDIQTLNFDKTGTLTTGSFHVKNISGNQDAFPILLALEKNSKHPIAKFISQFFAKFATGLALENYKEVPGKGPQADYEGHHYQVSSDEENQTVLYKDSEKLLCIELEEECTPNLSEWMNSLSKRYQLNVISGDTEKKMAFFKDQLKNVNKINFFAEQKPEDKEKILKETPNSIYVGDGLNDVHALKSANISISLNASQLVDDISDVIFMGGGLKKLNVFFHELRHLNNILNSNIILSIIYNTLAIYLVLSGAITPLAAAILMPISSLIVVLHSYLRNEWGAKK